ncbi:hypothetical protein RF11_12464 [Thelohanellus kitauei]|uniref:Uncharacterized protein n=1 Tax=Thelohanellus kitauei TaxID=669202 RepID=A0A0C2N9N9_THEKT|nr:hypothetical protein RF11_12464 [Thelohanellus kitauei]
MFKRTIRITSKFGNNLTSEYPYLDIQVETDAEFQKWRYIFVAKGVLCEEIRLIYKMLNFPNISHEEMIRYEKICLILEKYLSVNRIKIQDLMTKILMKPVIYDFEDFCTYHLSTHVLMHNLNDLFKIDEENKIDVKIKIEVNQKLKDCYERLLEYMGKYSITYRPPALNFSEFSEEECIKYP